ncbi:nuclease [uncultured Methanobrevibacter sp.]|uniref:nuclease n=1 Tax=uncultured Methanobrevibacter sp. TaxID=253161 RepID=UPI0025F5FD8B|nr:nuclease [uncultured Methanobrevibacter sp.]
MSEENKVYKILITREENDHLNQYDFYKERIDSQKDFLYEEYDTLENDLTDELFNEIDIIILLFGLYQYNPELFDELIKKSNKFNVPLLLVRAYGMEYILKELEEKSDAAVGWNPHCIINAIETLVNGEDWLKPCDSIDED